MRTVRLNSQTIGVRKPAGKLAKVSPVDGGGANTMYTRLIDGSFVGPINQTSLAHVDMVFNGTLRTVMAPKLDGSRHPLQQSVV